MDKIVAAAPMRDFILVFTERGKIYQVSYNDRIMIKIELLHHMRFSGLDND